jgi:hypothetical protein
MKSYLPPWLRKMMHSMIAVTSISIRAAAGDEVSIRHVDNVNHRSHNMPKFGSSRLKRRRDRFDGTSQLRACVPIEVRRAKNLCGYRHIFCFSGW